MAIAGTLTKLRPSEEVQKMIGLLGKAKDGASKLSDFLSKNPFVAKALSVMVPGAAAAIAINSIAKPMLEVLASGMPLQAASKQWAATRGLKLSASDQVTELKQFSDQPKRNEREHI